MPVIYPLNSVQVYTDVYWKQFLLYIEKTTKTYVAFFLFSEQISRCHQKGGMRQGEFSISLKLVVYA
jgi:hypothetical protein